MSSQSSSSSSASEDGWEDASADEEQITVVDFFSDKTFPSAQSMLANAKEQHGLDFLAIKSELGLDFYESIKLVNYIRSEAKSGDLKPNVGSKERFSDDKYLKPVLDDDALLFCLDDLVDSDTVAEGAANKGKAAQETDHDSAPRISELEEQLQRLQLQFAEYKDAVAKTLDKRWEDAEPASGSGAAGPSNITSDQPNELDDKSNDKWYFDSYSYNDIHETMLKDTVRTDAYRDFVYNHKQLFAGKTVLDIGCGTGILSMFCARAGAAKVIAVDNSSIIEKARKNVLANGLGDIVTCFHGKIEEVKLPVDKVDIIISEWMGYCLLFEAMLDSVLWARDRYLKPDGLMVPSHCTLRLAPIQDEEYIADNIEFWRDVYGFDMSAMMDKIHDDVLIRHLKPDGLAGKPTTFLELPLHTIGAKDLEFTKEFTVALDRDIEILDGWVLWFDTFFLTTGDAKLPPDAQAESWNNDSGKGVAFTTGPHGKETHWRSGVMLVDRTSEASKGRVLLKEGATVSGRITFMKDNSNMRGLKIGISWEGKDSAEKGTQSWTIQ